MGKWAFILDEFNFKKGLKQLGSIQAPNGLWFAAVESNCTFNESDEELIDDVIKVLNREMPNGKIRKHEKWGGKK